MTQYKQNVTDKNNDPGSKIPKDVRKLMGPKKSYTERRTEVLDENPGSYCISWQDVAMSIWSTIRTMYKTNGIFPPSIIVDHKNTPGTDTYRTEAQINASWMSWRDSDDRVKVIFPNYVELRIYHKNVMRCVYEKFKHNIPEEAMIAYMVAIIFHEYHHYLDYYDLSYDVDEKLSDEYSVDEYFNATGKMREFVYDKDEVKDECETEHSAILDTLRYMRYAYADGMHPKEGLAIIPGGPFDLMLRDKYKTKYRIASLMCEHLWIQWHHDFDENLTDEDHAKYNLQQKKICHSLKKHCDKFPSKMFIID